MVKNDYRLKAFKFKLHPNAQQQQWIQQIIGCSRVVFNHVLHENLTRANKSLPWLSKNDAIKTLPVLKKSLDWLKTADSIALQASVEYLYEGFERFQKEPKVLRKKAFIKQKETGYTPTAYDYKGHPKFKNKKNPVQSYTTKMVNNNIEINDNRIKLPKLGWMRFSKSREMEGNIKRVTVRKNNRGLYFVSIICEVPSSPYKKATNDAVGIDVGLKDFAILSNGEVVPNPKYYRQYEERLAFLQRCLARKQEGSKSYEKCQQQIAKLHEKIKHTREDFLHKLTTNLIHENQVIGLETLKVKNMVKNKKLSKSIHDASWATFVNMLTYKAKWYGRTIQQIDPFFPSSQLCSDCGFQHAEVKNLSVRHWTCPNCGTQHDRDVNAAINIRNEALRMLSEKENAPVGA